MKTLPGWARTVMATARSSTNRLRRLLLTAQVRHFWPDAGQGGWWKYSGRQGALLAHGRASSLPIKRQSVAGTNRSLNILLSARNAAPLLSGMRSQDWPRVPTPLSWQSSLVTVEKADHRPGGRSG